MDSKAEGSEVSEKQAETDAHAVRSRIRLKLPIIQQTILLFMSSIVSDVGELFQIVFYAICAYWIGFFLMMLRRRKSFTSVDLFLIHWGFVILCIVSIILTPLIWNLRGY